MNDSPKLPGLPGPDDTNIRGEVIDALRSLRSKKEAADMLLPLLWEWMWNAIEDVEAYPGAPIEQEDADILRRIQVAASMYGVTLPSRS